MWFRILSSSLALCMQWETIKKKSSEKGKKVQWYKLKNERAEFVYFVRNKHSVEVRLPTVIVLFLFLFRLHWQFRTTLVSVSFFFSRNKQTIGYNSIIITKPGKRDRRNTKKKAKKKIKKYFVSEARLVIKTVKWNWKYLFFSSISLPEPEFLSMNTLNRNYFRISFFILFFRISFSLWNVA